MHMKNVYANKNIFLCLLENICARTLQLFVCVYKTAHKHIVNAWENLYAKNTKIIFPMHTKVLLCT